MPDRPVQVADFDSRCPSCDEMIETGELISPNDDEEWCHAGDCAEG